MKHLVDVHVDRCIGCTRCMRACPTEAIRIYNNKVHLIQERCIYCGNCIDSCHKSAFKVSSDSFANLNIHEINVALLPISVYGMISNKDELGGLYQLLYDYGFDEVFDLSPVYENLYNKIVNHINTQDETSILSICPTVVRLVQLKYPSLITHLLPFEYPYEIGAKLAKKVMAEKYKLKEEQIGISYISECLSNFIAIKEAPNSNIDFVFLFHDVLRKAFDKVKHQHEISKTGVIFAKEGAFQSLHHKHVLSVDGIKQIDHVLEQFYLDRLHHLRLIEAYSCIGGCVGGNFTLENPFVSKYNIKELLQSIDENKIGNRCLEKLNEEDWFNKNPLEPLSAYKLGENMNQSIIKLNQINQILAKLPNIDCCACGSPSCKALAEDVVNKVKTLADCYMLKGGEK